jgi:hypothetical protein
MALIFICELRHSWWDTMASSSDSRRVSTLRGYYLFRHLPTVYTSREDRDSLRIPKSFAQLQALNHLLKKYRDIYPFRVFVCYVSVYLL